MNKLYPIAGRMLRKLDPEKAHGVTINALRFGLGPRINAPNLRVLHTRVFGIDFPNPIGLAAGFDKNAQVADAMLQLGFGFVEVGTVTPLPQSGNPRPRIFRLDEDGAVINRLGFNNQGLAAFKARLLARRGRPGIVGANIGANKDSRDRINDYVSCFESLIGYANYFTVNVSSPNTPGLRGLQDRDVLQSLLQKLLAVRARANHTPPLLLKIAPDLDDPALQDIVEVALSAGIDGLIISNTTISGRDALKNHQHAQQGGLSGRPLFEISTDVLRKAYRLANGNLPLIGVGGIASGADAYAKICAGASLVQLYTALSFAGPDLVCNIAIELAELLAKDGFFSVAEAVGQDS